MDLKKELCGLASNEDLIVFSSKTSTVSPSEAAETSTVQSESRQSVLDQDVDVQDLDYAVIEGQVRTRQTLLS